MCLAVIVQRRAPAYAALTPAAPSVSAAACLGGSLQTEGGSGSTSLDAHRKCVASALRLIEVLPTAPWRGEARSLADYGFGVVPRGAPHTASTRTVSVGSSTTKYTWFFVRGIKIRRSVGRRGVGQRTPAPRSLQS